MIEISTYGPAAITRTGTHMNSHRNPFDDKTSLLHHHDTVAGMNTHTNTFHRHSISSFIYQLYDEQLNMVQKKKKKAVTVLMYY